MSTLFSYIILGEIDPNDGTIERLFGREILDSEQVLVNGNEYNNPKDGILIYSRNNRTILLPDANLLDDFDLDMHIDFNCHSFGFQAQTTSMTEYLRVQDSSNKLLLEVYGINGEFSFIGDEDCLPEHFKDVESTYQHLSYEILKGDPEAKFIRLNFKKQEDIPVIRNSKNELTTIDVLRKRSRFFVM